MRGRERRGIPLKPKNGLNGAPSPLLPVHSKFEESTTRQLSHPLPVPVAKGGCPIQAVFWLEWDPRHSNNEHPAPTQIFRSSSRSIADQTPRLKPEESSPTRAAPLESRPSPHECRGSRHAIWTSLTAIPRYRRCQPSEKTVSGVNHQS
jgi:hypothetical protein